MAPVTVCLVLASPIVAAIPSADAQNLLQERLVRLEESISEEKLIAFARAYVVLQRIRREYEPTIQTARDPDEMTRIRQETNSRIEQVLQTQGLDVESYAKIFVAVSGDQSLQQRTVSFMQVTPP